MSADPREPNLPPTAQPRPSQPPQQSQQSQPSPPAQPGQRPPQGYPGQAGQPPYGYPSQAPQAPYGYPGQAPQSPYGYPAQAQGQQQPYGQQPYAQQQYGQQAYGQPVQPYQGYAGGYPAAGSYSAPASTRKSPVLGIVGFAVVVLAGIVSVILGLMMADPMAAIVALTPPGTTQIDVSTIPPALLDQLAGPMSGLGLAGLAGTGGWIVSIIAAVSNRGRGWGVGGIILGIIAPVAALIAMSVAAVAAVS